MPRSASTRLAGSMERPMAVHRSLHSAMRDSCSGVNFSIRDIANLLWTVFALNRDHVIPSREQDRVMFVVNDADAFLADAEVKIIADLKNFGLVKSFNLVGMPGHFSVGENAVLSLLRISFRNGFDALNQHVTLAIKFHGFH